MKGSAALAEMQEAMKDTEKGLPKDGDKLWDHLLKQDQKRLLEILAVCVASTVDTVHCVNRSTVYHADETAVAQLTAALKLDMTRLLGGDRRQLLRSRVLGANHRRRHRGMREGRGREADGDEEGRRWRKQP